MAMAAQDEKKPFEEKYEARKSLEELLKNDHFMEVKDSSVMKIAQAIIFHKLGSNYYEAEELSESER